MMRLSHLAIEVTRRCNIQCKHCIRGEAQNMNIPLKYIDMILDRVDSIGHFCPTGGEPSLNLPAIQYFIDKCIDRQIRISQFYISTNGINITQEFIDVCLDLYSMCDNKSRCSVQISNDMYHINEKKYDDTLLSCLPFYTKRYKEEYSDMKGVVVYEGLAAKNNLRIALRNFKSAKDHLYLNAEGELIDGDCWSYINQKRHKLCNVTDLEKFNKFMENRQKIGTIPEDWERIPLTDRMYLQERERELWEEYQEYMDEQERLPAKIVLVRKEELTFKNK